MGAEAPGDNWNFPDPGTWGTDADRDETVFASATTSLRLYDTAVATKLVGDWIPVNSLVGVYLAQAVLKADRNDPGDEIKVSVVLANSDKTVLGSPTYLYAQQAAESGVPVQHEVAGAAWEYRGARIAVQSEMDVWARFEVEKSAATFNAWIDSVSLEAAHPEAEIAYDEAFELGAQAIPPTTWERVNMNYQVRLPNGTQVGNGLVGVLTPGVYHVAAQVRVEGLTAGKEVDIRLAIHAFGTPRYIYGGRAAGGTEVGVSVSVPVYMDTGDSVQVEVWHNDTASRNPRNADADGYYNYLHVSLIGALQSR